MLIKCEKITDGQSICKRIEDVFNTKLPEKGFLAGQAVASAYFELNDYNFNPVYNDIDIFHDSPIENYTLYGLKSLKNKRPFINNTKMVKEHVFFEETKNGYTAQNIRNEDSFSIYESLRLDHFNFVRIINQKSQRANINQVIESFDINCTKIGVDLSTRELYLTNDFLKFLEVQKLFITDFGLPYHNPIRYMKKLNDLEIRESFDPEIIRLNNYSLSIHNLIEQKRMLQFPMNYKNFRKKPAFGNKYKNMFEEHEKLKEYYYICLDADYGNNISKLYKIIPKSPEIIQDNIELYKSITDKMNISQDNSYKQVRLLRYLNDNLI